MESLFMGFQQTVRALQRANDITAVQFLVLQWAVKEGPASMSDLAAFLRVRPQSVTPVVESLVHRGWLMRGRSRTDRRRTQVGLSDEARALMTRFHRDRLRRLRGSFRRLPPATVAGATRALKVSRDALIPPNVPILPSQRGRPTSPPRARRGRPALAERRSSVADPNV
ncbi:MAG: MarR family winged helix-turn-helix transcriptional regulator [Thermoplasmata archaeon]